MKRFVCRVCGYIYDEADEGRAFAALSEDWTCPVCGAAKSEFEEMPAESGNSESDSVPSPAANAPATALRPLHTSDELEFRMADIIRMSLTGESIIEPMRTKRPVMGWEDILIKGAQLARQPLNAQESVNARTVIGPKAKKPLVIETPIIVSHMSFGALSREAHLSLARGSRAAGTAMGSGEGGILPEALAEARSFIFEYVPNRYSVTEENLRRVDAVEIKFGQSTKPGMGGHLPGRKVTPEIAAIRGFSPGTDIISPARFPDIKTPADLAAKISELRRLSGGRPIGIKFAAGNVEADLEFALAAAPDFITIDGRPGATAASAKLVKDATSIPTVFALDRARKWLDAHGVKDVTLIITGGLRISSDFAKALALGADVVAIGTAALIAIGCRQFRVCHTGRCPVGIATHDPQLRARLNVDQAALGLTRFLDVSTRELRDFARLTGNADVHKLSVTDLATTSLEISSFTRVEHV